MATVRKLEVISNKSFLKLSSSQKGGGGGDDDDDDDDDDYDDDDRVNVEPCQHSTAFTRDAEGRDGL
jgi:hypothetical protein